MLRLFSNLAFTCLTASALLGRYASVVHADQNDKRLHIATFACDVTPPLGSPLCGGLIKPAQAIDDPLWAKGIILRDAGGTYVLCALDWCLLRGRAYDLFREKLAAAADTDPSRVAVQCTHPHNAPYTDPLAQEMLSEFTDAPPHADLAYLEAAARKVAAAVRAATDGRVVSAIGTSKAKVEKVASNRRVPLPDGSIGKRMSQCKDPSLRAAPEGLIDPWLRTITFFVGDKPFVQMHYYATHPQSYYGDGRVTYDFPGMARERLQEETGVFQMYFTACAGDIAAGKYNDGSHENRKVLADRMHAAMKESVANVEIAQRFSLEPISLRKTAEKDARTDDNDGAIEWRVVPVRFPRRNDEGYRDQHLREVLADSNAQPIARIRAAVLLAGFERIASGRPVELTSMRIGGVRILHLPGEPFVEYQLFAQGLRPDDFVAVAGYGDDFTGYICTEKSYAEGGYEPTSTVLDPSSEKHFRKAIVELLAVR